MWPVSLVLARLLVEPAAPAPQLTEDGVLLVQRTNAQIGCTPTAGDAGVGDAGVDDAGVDAGLDAGIPDPDCEPIFGDAVSLIVRPRFESTTGGTRFALLFVTPSRPIVEAVADPFFQLQELTGTKVEIDVIEIPDPALGEECNVGGCGLAASEPPPFFDPPDLGDGGLGDGPPAVETVGPYEIVRVQPADVAELQTVLDSLGYAYQQDDLDAVGPYLDRGFTVVAVRAAVDQPANGPLRSISLTWAGSELRLSAALGNSDTTGLSVYIAADGRYEFPGAGVPFAKHTFSGETLFLTRNDLGAMQVDSPDDDPIAVRIDGDPEFHLTTTITQERRVPVTNCGDVGCGCRDCNVRGGVSGDFGVVLLVIVLTLRKRRVKQVFGNRVRDRRR
jgi:hypothetical protein